MAGGWLSAKTLCSIPSTGGSGHVFSSVTKKREVEMYSWQVEKVEAKEPEVGYESLSVVILHREFPRRVGMCTPILSQILKLREQVFTDQRSHLPFLL